MPTGFAVSIDDLDVSARDLTRLHGRAGDALDAAGRALAGTAGMAGADPVLARWRAAYDPVATLTWAVTATSTITLSAIAGRLVATANNYLAADHASTPDAGGPPDLLPDPPPPRAPVAGPPPSTGPVGGPPPELAEYWPGGEPVLLRDAARAWSALAEHLDDVGAAADNAFRGLTAHNEGDTFSAMATFWARHYESCGTDPLFNAAPHTARTLGLACAALADVIELSRAEISRGAAEAAAELDRIEAPVQPLRRLTRGASEVIHLIAQVVLTSRFLDAYRDSYLADVDRLVADLHRIDLAHLQLLAAPPDPRPAVDVALDDIGDVVGLGVTGSAWDGIDGEHPGPDSVHLTTAARTHILDGDGRGGGHLSGTGIPRKSEFPPTWSGDRIVAEALALARAPQSMPEPGRERRWVIEGTLDGIRMRVIVEPTGEIVTAVPISGPGVIQNPRR